MKIFRFDDEYHLREENFSKKDKYRNQFDGYAVIDDFGDIPEEHFDTLNFDFDLPGIRAWITGDYCGLAPVIRDEVIGCPRFIFFDREKNMAQRLINKRFSLETGEGTHVIVEEIIYHINLPYRFLDFPLLVSGDSSTMVISTNNEVDALEMRLML